jgi:hypothetical protein
MPAHMHLVAWGGLNNDNSDNPGLSEYLTSAFTGYIKHFYIHTRFK